MQVSPAKKNSFLLSVLALSFACAGLASAQKATDVKGVDLARVKPVFTLASNN